MDILNSDWLINMLKKAGETPQLRLLGLFDILDQWCEAPGIKTQIQLTLPQTALPKEQPNALQHYLSLEAAKAGAAQPEMLAMQLYYIAQSALIEKIAGKNNFGIQHAKNAAKALIRAQTTAEFHIAKKSAYAAVASLLLATIVGSVVFFNNQNSVSNLNKVTLKPDAEIVTNASYNNSNAEQTADLIAQIEQMRHGSCHYPEALQLPDNLKGVYLDTVVNGRISTNLHEQQVAMALIKTIQCNYTPMLMANSR